MSTSKPQAQASSSQPALIATARSRPLDGPALCATSHTTFNRSTQTKLQLCNPCSDLAILPVGDQAKHSACCSQCCNLEFVIASKTSMFIAYPDYATFEKPHIVFKTVIVD